MPQDNRHPPDPRRPPPQPPSKSTDPEEREGATDQEVGDRSGPGAGYDNEPEQERDRGGVS